MNEIRSFLFNCCFYSLTFIACFVCLPALILPARVVFFCAYGWAKISLLLAHHICGIKLVVEGKENRLNPPAIFACKHQSAFETIALTALLKKPAFILKRELLYIPLFGLYLIRIGSIAINRKAGASTMRSMVKQTKEKLASGHSVVIFAEGTRTFPDNDNPQYHPGVAALYSQCDVPVIPVALNSGLCWGRKALRKKPGIVTIAFMPALPAQMERKLFLQTLKQVIESRSIRLRDVERTRQQSM